MPPCRNTTAEKYGIVTPVKSQGDTNLCWAYSSVAASETSILKTGINSTATDKNLDLNPVAAAYRIQKRQSDPLNNTNGEWLEGDYTSATGSPSKIATLFSCWWGPVSGSDATVDPFENSRYRLENAILISEYKDDYEKRIAAIKLAIAEYGAVTFQYNNAHNYEYYNPKNEKGGNSYPHACTLIGWNDDIPAGNFMPGGASRNGGWLVKNSYTGLPDGYPYFYMSYDNTSSVCYAFSYANRDAYDRNYYYDGGIDDFSLRNDKKVANVYRAAGSEVSGKTEQIKAVNVGVNGSDYTLEVEIYKNLDFAYDNSDAPVSGGKSVAVKRQSFAYGGFVTVKLDEPITIEKREWFSVIVKVVSGNAKIRLGYKNGKDLSYAGTSWGYSELGNYVGRIKAYTSLCDTEPEEHKHSLVRYEEVKATCTANGRKAHYECEVCGKSFADESATKELDESDLTIPASHKLKSVAEVKANCTANGRKAHYECEVCGKSFADESAMKELNESDLTIPASHKLKSVAEVKATCTANGRKAHYECEVCGKSFADESATKELNESDLTIFASHKLKSVAEVKANCTANGRKAHYECEVCGKSFADESATKELNESDLTIPASHKLKFIAEVKATCTANGRKAHYECEECGKSFADESATKELDERDLTIPAGHVFGEWQKEIPPTENEEGIKGHKDCAVCGKHFDKDGNEITDLKIPKKDAEQKPDDGKGDDKPDLTVKSGCGSRNEFLLPSVSVIALIAIKKRRRSS